MKKTILILFAILALVSCVTAATDTAAAVFINEETAQQLAEKTIIIADALDKQIIKGVDNGVTGTLISLAIAAIFRAVEKRRVIRKVKERERLKFDNFFNGKNG